MYVLLELDRQLENDTILYVKLHNYVNIMMNFKVFKHIRPFPEEYETYEFLNIADALITDYSSVFFDYANTKKKIILFAHDKEEYLSTRGMYLNYEELPFNILTDIKDLLKEIKNINEYSEYKKFNDEFCNYDSKNTTKQVCDYIFKGIKSKHIKVVEGRKFSNNKDNVLLFGGDLAKNGITTALKGLYKNIDLTKRNYFLTFYKTYVERNKQQINFFENIDYIPIQGICNVTAFECFINYLYKHYDINNKFINKIIDNIYKREAKRVYPNIEFKYVMHFTGYESKETYMFNNMNSKKIIFVHNDMQKEEKNKRVNKKLLIQAYKRYDKIALIRKELLSTIKKYLRKEDENKICVVHNLNNIETILENKNKEIVFDKETYSNIELNELKKILNDKNSNKFIDIARFSEQKGLDRLVIAFDKFQNKNPNNYLIIIGGYGNQFNKINNLIKELNNKNIILIKSLNNPYSILNKSNCFVLSSYYEGLPMTVMEALILGVKVISTDIEGPREFLSQGYGHLVDNSLEGLIEGFNDYINGKLDSLKKFDYQEFNKNALEEFESLFD